MDVLPASSLGLAVPDSAYPFSDELQALAAGILECPPSPDPQGALKPSLQGDSCGYFAPSLFPPFPFDQDMGYDWMSEEALLLPTPEEQETDLTFVPGPQPMPYSPFALPTPDSSSPSTPASCTDPEVLDALSLMEGSSSPTGQLGPASSHTLPQFDSHSPLPSPSTSFSAYSFSSTSPCDPAQSTFLPSPLLLPPHDLSPDSFAISIDSKSPSSSSPTVAPADFVVDLTSSPSDEGIRSLLKSSEEEKDDSSRNSAGTGRQRKSQALSDSATAEGPKGKRRRLTKTAKKERKKEQNKQAAVRYRQRKRGEADQIEEQREELEAVNSDLKRQVKALVTEISYLKNLWQEVSAARAQRSD